MRGIHLRKMFLRIHPSFISKLMSKRLTLMWDYCTAKFIFLLFLYPFLPLISITSTYPPTHSLSLHQTLYILSIIINIQMCNHEHSQLEINGRKRGVLEGRELFRKKNIRRKIKITRLFILVKLEFSCSDSSNFSLEKNLLQEKLFKLSVGELLVMIFLGNQIGL